MAIPESVEHKTQHKIILCVDCKYNEENCANIRCPLGYDSTCPQCLNEKWAKWVMGLFNDFDGVDRWNVFIKAIISKSDFEALNKMAGGE